MEAKTHPPAWKVLLAFAIIYFVWGSTFLAIRVGGALHALRLRGMSGVAVTPSIVGLLGLMCVNIRLLEARFREPGSPDQRDHFAVAHRETHATHRSQYAAAAGCRKTHRHIAVFEADDVGHKGDRPRCLFGPIARISPPGYVEYSGKSRDRR